MMKGHLMFGQWVKHRRSFLGLTQTELARRVGCAPITLRKIEAGDSHPSLELATQLAEYLDLAGRTRSLFVQVAQRERSTEVLPPPTHTVDSAAPRPPIRRPSTLPSPTTSLIGRDGEVVALRTLLRDPGVRLVTLSGPAGVGKTRLALQVASDLREDFADGVFFINLAPLSDPALVIPAVAQMVGVKEESGRPLPDSLADALSQRHALLVLDNFEQVVAAAPSLSVLLSGAPTLKLLVTSREVLQVYGEQVYPVSPLALPDLAHLPPPNVLARSPAVALFVARARAVKPDFQLTSANAASVAETCVRLDGLPLAIELAAARSRLLPPRALLQRLDSRLAVLTGGARDLPSRQRTLRDAIGWSYDLLEESEKRLFRRLGIFVGGCTLAAVEAVCGDDDGPTAQDEQRPDAVVRRDEVLDYIASLVDKSLVRAQESVDDEPRFTLLATIREYALERLEKSDNAPVLAQRHAAFFLTLAEDVARQGATSSPPLALLEVERENVRAALNWAVQGAEAGDAQAHDLGLRLAGSLGQFWQQRGYWSEGLAWLERLLKIEGACAGPARAKALLVASALIWNQGDFQQAARLSEEGLALYQAQGDRHGIAEALVLQGVAARAQRDYDRATSLLENSLAVFRDLGETARMAEVLSHLGSILFRKGDYRRCIALREERLALLGDAVSEVDRLWHAAGSAYLLGDLPRARTFYEKVLPFERASSNKGREAYALLWLAHTARRQGEYQRATSLFEEGIALYRELAAKRDLGACLRGLGLVTWAEGDFIRARALMEESLALHKLSTDKLQVAEALAGLGRVLASQGELEQARESYGEALAIYREVGDRPGTAEALLGLGQMALATGDLMAARRLLGESLAVRGASDDPDALAARLEALAHLGAAQGELIGAVRLLAAAAALRETVEAPIPMVQRTEYERTLGAVRAQLGEDLFAEAWANGRTLTRDAAVDAALGI